MKKALDLAKKGYGFTSPNPCVGALIVCDGEVVAEGFHVRAGEDHAEVAALKDAAARGIEVQGLDMYVTLEPCCHFGKTGPCCDALINAEIKRVFVGMLDPNSKVAGAGVERLMEAGIEVEVLSDKDLMVELYFLNRFFIKSMKTGLPYVILKAGISADNCMSLGDGKRILVTSDRSRQDARLERSVCDAVLIGSGTAKIDQPDLLAHGKWLKKNLLRIVLGDYKWGDFFVDSGEDLIKLLERLSSEMSVQSLFVEGGAKVHKSFFEAGLCDEILVYQSVNELGGSNDFPYLDGLDLFEEKMIGSDLKKRALINIY